MSVSRTSTESTELIDPTQPQPVINQPVPEKTLCTWSAPSRLFKRRSREFYTTVGALVLLLSLILFFAKEFLLIGVILATGFISYVLASVPPDQVQHELTNKCIRTGGLSYLWETLGRYWWLNKWKQDYVVIETPDRLPTILTLLVPVDKKDEVDKILKTYLINEKPQPTWIDNAAKWLQEKVPLESEQS